MSKASKMPWDRYLLIRLLREFGQGEATGNNESSRQSHNMMTQDFYGNEPQCCMANISPYDKQGYLISIRRNALWRITVRALSWIAYKVWVLQMACGASSAQDSALTRRRHSTSILTKSGQVPVPDHNTHGIITNRYTYTWLDTLKQIDFSISETIFEWSIKATIEFVESISET